MADANLTAEEAREYLAYDPITGVLTWRFRHRNTPAGTIAGCLHKSTGYWRIGVCGQKHHAHRLAWLIHHGHWPATIDHINGVKTDNRLENLRAVDQLINNQNRRAATAGSASPLLGAIWHRSSGMWKSAIRANGKSIHIGLFHTPEEAHAAYIQAKRLLHAGCTL